MARRLVSSRYLLVASPGYIRKQGLPRRVEELAGHRGILYSNVHPNDQLRFKRDGGFVTGHFGTSMHTGHFGTSMQVNNGDIMRDAVIAGLGLARISHHRSWRGRRGAAVTGRADRRTAQA